MPVRQLLNSTGTSNSRVDTGGLRGWGQRYGAYKHEEKPVNSPRETIVTGEMHRSSRTPAKQERDDESDARATQRDADGSRHALGRREAVVHVKATLGESILNRTEPTASKRHVMDEHDRDPTEYVSEGRLSPCSSTAGGKKSVHSTAAPAVRNSSNRRLSIAMEEVFDQV